MTGHLSLGWRPEAGVTPTLAEAALEIREEEAGEGCEQNVGLCVLGEDVQSE